MVKIVKTAICCTNQSLIMASGDLDVPQIAAVGLLEGNDHTTPTQTLLCPSSDNSHPPVPDGHAISPADNHFVPHPTPIPRPAQISSDTIDSPSPASHISDTSSLRPPPSLAPSAHSSDSIQFPISTVLRDNNTDEHDGLSSLKLLAPSSLHNRRKGNIDIVPGVGSSSTEREVEADQSSGLSPVRSAQSDVASPPPSPTHTHVDTSSGVISHPSSTASFFRATLHPMRQSSPSPSDKTFTGSDETQDNGQKGDNADVKRNRAQLIRPAVLDLNQEPDLDVHPFAFNPLQLASLFNPRNLETLEVMGGVDAILRALGTHPTHGLSTILRPPSYLRPPDPASQDFRESHTAKEEPLMLNSVTLPAAVPQGLQSLASLAGRSGASLPTAFQGFQDVYRASIEDRKRIFGGNIIPQRTNKTLLQLIWLALKDKVLVC